MRVDGNDEEDAAEARKELGITQQMLADANKAIEDLEKFNDTIKKDWDQPKQRTIGHIRSSPAIAFNVGPKGFTEDWGAFELDGPNSRTRSRATSLILVRFDSSHPHSSSLV